MTSSDDNFIDSSGVILSRKEYGENSLYITLFMKETGIMTASAVSSSSTRSRFGGDTEPFIWGRFILRKKRRGRNYYVDDIEVFDDMIALRKDGNSIITALKWSRFLKKYLMYDHPDDDLLNNLYWNMKLLCEPVVPSYAADWRFIWLWLEEWGIAPDMEEFYSSMKFNNDEINLLSETAYLNTKAVIKLFSVPLSHNIRENMFKVASSLASKFLNEV